MAGATQPLTAAQFSELDTDGQSNHLNSQIEELNVVITGVQEEPGKSILTKVKDFIVVLLAFTTNLLSKLKDLIGTTQEMVTKMAKQTDLIRDHETRLDAVMSKLDNVYDDGRRCANPNTP